MSDIVKPLPYSVDLSKPLDKTDLHTLFVMGDNQAHRFELEIMSGSKAEDLTGCTVTGYFTNFKEDTTITVPGKVEGGKAVVTLSKPCYTLHGQFVLSIQIKSGEVEDTVFLGEGFMRRTKGETIIYDDYIVYDVSTLLAQISAMRTATENANKAAEAANAAAEHAPYVDAATGYWMYWDAGAGKYVSTGTPAAGPQGAAGNDGADGETPYIGSNGNWWIGQTDTGVKAQGPAGQNGTGSGTVTAVTVSGMKYEPDQTGNVDLGELGGGEGTVQSVCGVLPDEEGDVQLDMVEADLEESEDAGEDVLANADLLGGMTLAQIVLMMYPVGAIYTSTVATSPATLFGGTWESIGGKFLLGADGTYSAGNTGGEASHTLTTDEMPSHKHTADTISGKIEPRGNGDSGFSGDTTTASGVFTATKWSTNAYAMGSNNALKSGTVNGFTFSATPTINNTGGGKAHNNMPPYLAVYMWKRTA